MLPFTSEMYEVYQMYKLNEQLYNFKFEYNTAIGQLTDESTEGDFNEIKFLKHSITNLMNNYFSEYQQKLILEYKNCLSYDK